MSIKIQTHGGRCCGIKTIHGFSGKPEGVVGPKKSQPYYDDTDKFGNSVGKYYNWYRPSRPKETYLQRLEEYIRYIKEKRPKGLIEVTLTTHQLDGYDWMKEEDKKSYAWRPVIERLGFREVSKFKNSNTSMTVHVFHLIYD